MLFLQMTADVDKRRAHLSLIGAEAYSPQRDLDGEVRAARRDMARWLRALHASGRSVTSWPDEVVTRLAHIDAITARFVIHPGAFSDSMVRDGLAAIRALERWMLDRLTPAERAEVQEFALMIRIDERELEAPLLQPDSPFADHESRATPRLARRSLRAGISALRDEELVRVAQRLGVATLPQDPRDALEQEVQKTLRDDHLLGILLATLTLAAHQVLAALVRRRFDRPERLSDARGTSWVDELGELRRCGLVFLTPEEQLWVPMELERRLDGVLRAFGV